MPITQRVVRAGVVAVVLVLAIVLVSCSADGSTTDDSTSTTVATGGGGESSTTIASTTSTVPDETTDAPVAGILQEDCLLLTQEQLESATDVPFGEGTVNSDLSNDRQVMCDWVSTDLSAFAFVQVLIADYPYEETKAGTASAYTLVDVSIPGATAAYATEEGSLIGMEVGDLYVQVSYIPSGPGNVLDITTELATEAVAAM